MKTLTHSLATIAALVLALVDSACTEGVNPPADDDGNGGRDEGNQAGGGSIGEGGSPSLCDTQDLVGKATFAPTGGPDASMFTHVAAKANVVIATTGTGVHRSTDEGATWTFLDAPEISAQPINAMAAFRSDLFVSSSGVLYRSTDDGTTWQKAFPGDFYVSYLSNHDDEHLYVLANAVPYEWHAQDGRWELLMNPESIESGEHRVFDVVESDGTALYANSIYSPGVFRMELADESRTWTQVMDLPEWGYKAFAFFDGKGFAGNSEHLFASFDAGATWAPIGNLEWMDTSDLLVRNGVLIAATSSGLATSTDAGATWTVQETGQPTSTMALAGTSEHLFSAASQGLLRAEAPGSEWSRMHVLADQVFTLGHGDRSLISISAAGFQHSADEGASWQPVDLPADQGIYYLSPFVNRDGRVLTLGYNALLVSDDDGASFEPLPIAPAGQYGWVNLLTVVDDALVIGIAKGATQCPNGSDISTTLYRSDDGGATWIEAFQGLPTTFSDCYGHAYTPWVTSLTQTGDVLLATTNHNGVFRKAGDGAWTPVEVGDGYVQAFLASNDVVFGASPSGGLVRSSDRGLTWTAPALTDYVVTSFAAVGQTTFASVRRVDGQGAGGVFYTSDGGDTWQLVDTDFRSPVAALTVLGDTLFAGTAHQSTWSAPLSCAP